MRLLLTLAAAAVVGYVFTRLRVPGGTIIGAMLGAATVSVAWDGANLSLPRPLVMAAYVVIGTVIGSGITRDALVQMRSYALPAVMSALMIIAFGLTTAVVLRLLGVAPTGVVLATSPGALSATTAVAAEQGVGVPVAVFHTVRVMLVLLTLPLLIRLSGA